MEGHWMKARMMLAEAAVGHQDGTLSMLRAGITHAWGKTAPVGLQSALAVRIEGEMGDSGSHTFDLRCMDSDGAEVMSQLKGQFDVPKGGGVMNFVMNFSLGFPRHGRYTFVLRVDNVQQDTWPMTIAENPPGGAQP
jgi:hypothetical protein